MPVLRGTTASTPCFATAPVSITSHSKSGKSPIGTRDTPCRWRTIEIAEPSAAMVRQRGKRYAVCIKGLPTQDITPELFDRATEVKQRFGLSYWKRQYQRRLRRLDAMRFTLKT